MLRAASSHIEDCTRPWCYSLLGMRYRRNDPGKPWPLYERLWEAQQGLWVGLSISAILLACVLVLFTLVSYFVLRNEHPILASLDFVWRLRWTFLLIFGWSIFLSWMKELALVNEGTETFEEFVVRRLQRIEETLAGGPPFNNTTLRVPHP